MESYNFPQTKLFRCNATLGQENIAPAGCTCEIGVLEKKINDISKNVAIILENQAKSSVAMQQLFTKVEISAKFPIKHNVELQKIDLEIGENMDKYIEILKKIIHPIGINKSLEKILCMDVILKYNFDGVQDKLPFKKFENLNNALFVLSGLHSDGYNKKEYMVDIKNAFKLAKNRHFKNASVQKCKTKKNNEK